MEFRVASNQPSDTEAIATRNEEPSVLPSDEYAEEGEAEMVISSDEDSA